MSKLKSELTSGNLLFDEVYERLHKVAQLERRRVSAGQTLNTTALVHEVYIDLCAAQTDKLAPRDFFGYAAIAMRNLLIDHARRAARPKHGGDLQKLNLDQVSMDCVHVDAAMALDLDNALSKLALEDPRAAEVVELHFFAGMGLAQIAEILEISERTVNRDWRVAKAWLLRELTP